MLILIFVKSDVDPYFYTLQTAGTDNPDTNHMCHLLECYNIYLLYKYMYVTIKYTFYIFKLTD